MGVAALDISADGSYIATLSAVKADAGDEDFEQTLAIWEWAASEQDGRRASGTRPPCLLSWTWVLATASGKLTRVRAPSLSLGFAGPVYSERLPLVDVQTCVRFNPTKPEELMSNGAKHVFFWDFSGGHLRCYAPRISKRNFRKSSFGAFTASCFLPGTPGGVSSCLRLYCAPSPTPVN